MYKKPTKPYRFWVRDEIEDIVKELNIDRTRFHEFSKLNYEDIIRKFYFSFSDRKNYTPSIISLSYYEMHLRNELESYCIDGFFRTRDWLEYLKSIKKEVPDKDKKLFLILEQGWVYEGYADEIFSILEEISHISDFYIVSSKFEWFIAVSNISDNATMYKR